MLPWDQECGYHASVELELSDGLSPEEIHQRITDTFALVKDSVENQIQGEEPPKSRINGNGRSGPPRNNNPASRDAGSGANGNSKATNAQIKYMTSLASDQNIPLGELTQFVKDEYGVDSLYDLTKNAASKLVDGLKNGRIKIRA